MMVIVPQGTWHRFHAPEGVTVVTATPKPTEHLTVDVEDPARSQRRSGQTPSRKSGASVLIRDSMTKTFDARQDLIGRLGPPERFGRSFVMSI